MDELVEPHTGILLSNKKDKLLIHATMWTNLKFFMLSREGHTILHIPKFYLYDSLERAKL